MNNTQIEWCDGTWNPVRGCSRVSEGCRFCYAERVAARFSGDADRLGAAVGEVTGPFAGFAKRTAAGPRWTGKVELVPKKLGEPLSWRKKVREVCSRCTGSGSSPHSESACCSPCDGRGWTERPRRVFVNSMSDLFHEALSFPDIAAVFGIMAACPEITFLILTKRPERMAEFFRWCKKRGEQGASLFPDDDLDWRIRQMCHVEARRRGADLNADLHQNHGGPWPLPNVWLGTSIENQEAAEKRLRYLRDSPAALRFLSVEPLLAPVNLTTVSILEELKEDLSKFAERQGRDGEEAIASYTEPAWCDVLSGKWFDGWDAGTGGWTVDWVIVGGESGPEARPMHPDWARALRDQCREAGVPFFFKQWGEWAPGENCDCLPSRKERTADWTGESWLYGAIYAEQSEALHADDEPDVYRCGKKAAGRLLDGQEYSMFPGDKWEEQS